MRKNLFFIVFALLVQLLYGQEKYIIQGEFPDNSLDGKYIICLLYTSDAADE